ncbi:glucose-6-phosphate dehydrogenase [Bacillus sp. V33-4]|uniref:glucose-6-phosphate dehydrogenase n=1 Tax=Bacillus sp. V33-4 TaxID=2054169 RepID=UPI000C765953|nr:glucose-6-phosphate dehydrogenase [Bacillus sp. V33-4]PLR80224.1 glucose-6-phosphate dehydrogenase [Bacillus sp. V33-4]
MDSLTFVLFGATGDLAKRKIFPSLFNLFLDGKMPKSFAIIGLGRRDWTNDVFREHVQISITQFSRRQITDSGKLDEFLGSFWYSSLDVTNNEGYRTLLRMIQNREEQLNIPENRLFYLSVAPEFFDVIVSNIKASGLQAIKGWKRLIIEKPFGHDLKSAQELNAKLSKAFQPDEIFLIDHYLGKPMVQNLEALEFANPMFKALWSNKYIANVQITASETVGVEERAGYYDHAGAIRDMVQNHMLQLVMMTAMHQPAQLSADDIRNEKTKIMESLRPLQKEDIVRNVVRGQYSEGYINDQPVPAYTNEPGIQDSSMNDTFIAARLWIDDLLWSGVPFYIRTGKRMREKSTRIVIEFKNPLEDVYRKKNEQTAPNLLSIDISPNQGVSLQFNSKNALKNGKIEPVTVKFFENQKDMPEAYELLLSDALRGDSTFFVQWKEVELSWKWVQPILDAFDQKIVPLHSYPSGSMGPEASHGLLREDGFSWW